MECVKVLYSLDISLFNNAVLKLLETNLIYQKCLFNNNIAALLFFYNLKLTIKLSRKELEEIHTILEGYKIVRIYGDHSYFCIDDNIFYDLSIPADIALHIIKSFLLKKCKRYKNNRIGSIIPKEVISLEEYHSKNVLLFSK